MPTIPLYSQPATPDGWHAVRAPGGYEWWHFEAGPPVGTSRVIVDFFNGNPFSPAYRKACRKFKRNPTLVKPPVPSDFSQVRVALFRDAKLVRTFGTGETFVGSPDRLHGRIGESSFEVNDNREIIVRAGSKDSVLVELRFCYVSPYANEYELVPDLRWIPTALRCDVYGQVHLGGEVIPHAGWGVATHYVSLVPPQAIATDWFRGSVMFDDATWVFHKFGLVEPTGHAVLKAYRATLGEFESVELSKVDMEEQGGHLFRPGYPLEMNFSDQLTLSNPRVLKATSRYVSLVYDASSLGQQAAAFCEVNRLR
jgi:hypothetical protein